MSYSLNEIEALCKCAARGSGLSWGLAEEAARATRWLVSDGLPGPEMLAALLELNDRQLVSDVAPESLSDVWFAPLGRMSPIVAGAAMSDSAARISEGESIVMQNLTQPLLVVPFAASVARQRKCRVMIAWDDVGMSTDGYTLSMQGNPRTYTTQHTHTLICSVGAAIINPLPTAFRGHLDTDSWACLSEFAGRTYAPATAQSRASGAGADLDNND